MAMVTKYIDLGFTVKDPKKVKKKGFGSKKPITNVTNPNDNNNNNIVNFNKINNNSYNIPDIDNDDNNNNDNKNNDNNINAVGVPTPRRKDPPISNKRLPKDPTTKIPTDNHVKWVIDSKNLDRQMLILQQDLEISNKRKDKWGKEQKSSCLSPRNNNNSNNNNNFGTRVRKDPHTSGPILFNKSNHNEYGIHNHRWNKDTELIDKEERAKPTQPLDGKSHEKFVVLQQQIKSNNKSSSNNSIQIMRNNSLILRTESAIFD